MPPLKRETATPSVLSHSPSTPRGPLPKPPPGPSLMQPASRTRAASGPAGISLRGLFIAGSSFASVRLAVPIARIHGESKVFAYKASALADEDVAELPRVLGVDVLG